MNTLPARSFWVPGLLSVFLLVACDASKPEPQAKPAAAPAPKATDEAAPKATDAKGKAEAKAKASDAAKKPEAKGDAAPKAPANGCPLAVTSTKVESEDDSRALELQVYNTSDTLLTNYSIVARYKNAAGEMVKTSDRGFDTISFSSRCKPKSKCSLRVPFIPKEAHSAEAVIVETLTWPEGAKGPETTWKLKGWDSLKGSWPG